MDANLPKQFNILIVDDNPKNIQVIGNILKDEGYLIGFATSGEQALALLKKSYDYDLILLDINMPGMNGFETCIAIRKDERLKEIPVIFLTAYTDTDNVIAGFESGAQDYVVKPFNVKELLARVNTHLDLKHKSDLIKMMNQELELKVAERTRELEVAYNNLNNLDNMKTDYLLFISQEIRAPLNGMMGSINLIKNQEYSSTFKNLIETLSSSISRLEDFTQKALFFNQLAKGAYTLQSAPVKLKDIVHFVLLELAESIAEKHLGVDTGKLTSDAIVEADKDLVFKVILSVLDNSVKFSPANGTISVMLDEDGHSVAFTCRDLGPGFKKEILDLFVLPFHLMNNIDYQRSIMSLVTDNQIMALHKGEFSIGNNAGGGAWVKLTFPKS